MQRRKSRESAFDYLSPLLSDTSSQSSEKKSTCSRIGEFLSKIIPYGGLASSTFNLVCATLGPGVLSVPSAFNFCGLIVALAILLIVTLATVYSIRILMEARELTRLDSYEAMAKGLLGPGWDYVIALMMWFLCIGACIASVICVNQLLIPLISIVNAPEFFQTRFGEIILTSLVWLIGMLPVSLPKHLNSLRYASMVAVFCVIFFIIYIIIHALQNGFKSGKLHHDFKLWDANNLSIEGLSLFMFVYLCQVNSFGIAAEMVDLSVRRMTIASCICMFLCFIGYVLAGFFGYADFGNEVTDSVLTLYDIRGDVIGVVAYVCIVIKLCVGFALCFQPARDACYYVLGLKLESVPTWKHIIFCVSMSFLCLVAGVLIPNVNTVFGLIGSLCGGLLGFCLPAVYRMYCGKWGIREVGIVNYLFTYSLLLVGVVATVFGTVSAIYEMFP